MYNETLSEYNTQNEELRQKAKKIYEDYKQIKKEVYKGRVALKKKKEELKKEVATNTETNKKISSDILNIKKELRFFKNEMGLEKDNVEEVKEKKQQKKEKEEKEKRKRMKKKRKENMNRS